MRLLRGRIARSSAFLYGRSWNRAGTLSATRTRRSLTLCVIQSARACACRSRGHNAGAGHSSSLRIARALLMDEPPSIDGNELTDKGYIYQRAGLERRASLVARLYADVPDEDVIIVD